MISGIQEQAKPITRNVTEKTDGQNLMITYCYREEKKKMFYQEQELT